MNLYINLRTWKSRIVSHTDILLIAFNVHRNLVRLAAFFVAYSWYVLFNDTVGLHVIVHVWSTTTIRAVSSNLINVSEVSQEEKQMISRQYMFIHVCQCTE